MKSFAMRFARFCCGVCCGGVSLIWVLTRCADALDQILC